MKRVAALIAVAALVFTLRGVASDSDRISASDDRKDESRARAV